MPDYRVYLINAEGHFVRSAVVTAETDCDAIARAELVAEGRELEIWQASRCVLAARARPASPDGPQGSP